MGKKNKKLSYKRGRYLKPRKNLIKKKERGKYLKQYQKLRKDRKVQKTGVSDKEKKDKKILSRYNVNADGVLADIKIYESEGGRIYEATMPEISKATSALLDTIKQRLVSEVEIIETEITDAAAIKRLKEKLREKARYLIQQEFKISGEASELLIGMLLNEMIGLGNIEILVSDPQLEEIVILSEKEQIRVYHKIYGWLITNLFVDNEKQIENYAAIIGRRVGRQITTLTPILDAHLLTGDRVNAVLHPICTKGNTITIRKFARDPWTIVDFIENKTCSVELFALLWTAIQYEFNVLFSGGTASGKTTMLNVCMPFIPSNHRIVSIEDTRELQLPTFLYWAPLVTRLPNPEGKGEITMLDLLVNSLRMRPDRIILGEMRRQREAEVLFEAMHTGHSVYATVHADTAAETISRLVNPPINVPQNLLKAVDLCVVMFRDRRKGIRRVYQLAEFISEEEKVRVNILFRWDPSRDNIVKHFASQRFFDDLSRHTGLSLSEINKEIEFKKKILNWLVKNNIRSMDETTRIIQKYYTDMESIKKLVK